MFLPLPFYLLRFTEQLLRAKSANLQFLINTHLDNYNLLNFAQRISSVIQYYDFPVSSHLLSCIHTVQTFK